MSVHNYKLKPEDETIIGHYLSTAPDRRIDFEKLFVYKWGQRWLVKDEVLEKLEALETYFRDSARKVALAMCMKKAQDIDFDKRFSDEEEVGFYFVHRIFARYQRRTANPDSRKPGFYDHTFWLLPNVLVWILGQIDLWFSAPSCVDSFAAFQDEQVLEILGPNPRTDPDYPD